MSRLYMMVSIINRGMRREFQKFYKEYDHCVMFSTLGKGTAARATLDYFGLENTEKVVALSVVTEETWIQIKRGLFSKMQIDIPGRGIVFTIPLSSIGGKKVLQFLIQDYEFQKEEESKLRETEYELLMIIVDQGYIDTVVDVARDAGAGGGTVIHAKGTGMAGAQKFLGVSLAEEKEIILIVAKHSKKNAIMKAIMEKAGLHSKEKAIVFSLPVTSVAGLRLSEEED